MAIEAHAVRTARRACAFPLYPSYLHLHLCLHLLCLHLHRDHQSKLPQVRLWVEGDVEGAEDEMRELFEETGGEADDALQ